MTPKARQAQRREAFRSAGCCPECGTKPLTGHVYCLGCRQYARTHARQRVARQTLDGLCIRCSKPQHAGTVFCLQHRLDNAAANKRYRRRIKAQTASTKGGDSDVCNGDLVGSDRISV